MWRYTWHKASQLCLIPVLLAFLTICGIGEEPENLALGKPVWTSGGIGQGVPELLTDGNTASNPYLGGPSRVQVDLEKPTLINVIKLWHYWQDGRTYHQNRVAVTLKDKKLLQFEQFDPDEIVFDNDVDGEYPETAEGKTIEFEPREVRYIHAWVGGNTVNQWSHWVEIQAFYVPYAVDPKCKIADVWGRIKSGW